MIFEFTNEETKVINAIFVTYFTQLYEDDSSVEFCQYCILQLMAYFNFLNLTLFNHNAFCDLFITYLVFSRFKLTYFQSCFHIFFF